MNKISIKTPEELATMEEGGKKLSFVKHALMSMIKEGVTASEVENRAVSLIKETGGEAAFMKVPDYSWATCVNINSGLVHGIPHKTIIFKNGDVVSVDLGLLYKDFYTDTSFTVAINPSDEIKRFLDAGQKAFDLAAGAVKEGNKIYDLSEKIEDTLTLFGYTPIRDLTGHGIGKSLHELPYIHCYVAEKRENSLIIEPGMALAIEVMYAMGDSEVITEKDGWTISMADGKISALFEDTIIVTRKGSRIITG